MTAVGEHSGAIGQKIIDIPVAPVGLDDTDLGKDRPTILGQRGLRVTDWHAFRVHSDNEAPRSATAWPTWTPASSPRRPRGVATLAARLA